MSSGLDDEVIASYHQYMAALELRQMYVALTSAGFSEEWVLQQVSGILNQLIQVEIAQALIRGEE